MVEPKAGAILGYLLFSETLTIVKTEAGKAGGLQIRRCQGLAVPASGRLHPWRLGSEAFRLLQHWGSLAIC